MKKILITLMVLAVVCGSAFADDKTVVLTNSVPAGTGITNPTGTIVVDDSTDGYKIGAQFMNGVGQTYGAVPSEAVTSYTVPSVAGGVSFKFFYSGNETTHKTHKIVIASAGWVKGNTGIKAAGQKDNELNAITVSAITANSDSNKLTNAVGDSNSSLSGKAKITGPISNEEIGEYSLTWSAKDTMVAGEYQANITITISEEA